MSNFSCRLNDFAEKSIFLLVSCEGWQTTRIWWWSQVRWTLCLMSIHVDLWSTDWYEWVFWKSLIPVDDEGKVESLSYPWEHVVWLASFAVSYPCFDHVGWRLSIILQSLTTNLARGLLRSSRPLCTWPVLASAEATHYMAWPHCQGLTARRVKKSLRHKLFLWQRLARKDKSNRWFRQRLWKKDAFCSFHQVGFGSRWA